MRNDDDSSEVLRLVEAQIHALEAIDLNIVDDSVLQNALRNLMARFGARPIGINTANHVFRVRANLDERLHSSRGLLALTPRLIKNVCE
jgi:hypothetical protein